MNKLFGTDGIRGIAGEALDPLFAARLGSALACVVNKDRKYKKKPFIVIGADTRRSSPMLASALASGICGGGCDAVMLGVVPTPAVAYATRISGACGGVMISASHNPPEYNGIKVFASDGRKLSDEAEDELEQLIRDGAPTSASVPSSIGMITDGGELVRSYTEHIAKYISISEHHPSLSCRVLIDNANGSACATTKSIFVSDDGIQYSFINDAPSGDNINLACGSTDTARLSSAVKSGGYNLGIAFDGDADRCILTDECGRIIDGDDMLAAFSRDITPELKHPTPADRVIITEMSNLGLIRFFERCGIPFDITSVGDRYVAERMHESGARLGGEQSGHIIFSDAQTTGDGQLTAARAISLLAKSDAKASELFSCVRKYPQVTRNIDADERTKKAILQSEDFKIIKNECVRQLGKTGRLIVRPSGTEPLLRIMLEGEDKGLIEALAQRLYDAAKAAAQNGN